MNNLFERGAIYDIIFNQLGDSPLERLIAIGVTLIIRTIISYLIFYLGKRLIQHLLNLFDRIHSKSKIDSDVYHFSKSCLRVVLYLILVVLICSAFGVSQGSIVAILGAAGVGIGFALKDTLSNCAGGIVILLFRPYSKGNFIEVNDKMGSVHEINMFSNELNTIDNKRVIIPNGIITSTEVTNFSTNKVRRGEIIFRVSHDSDYERALEILNRISSDQERIIQTIEKTIRLREIGESSINLIYRVWCKTEDYWPVYYDSTELVKKSFEREGIRIPLPQLDLHLHKVDSQLNP